MGKQPGVMLYFDIRPSLNRMSREEKGSLLEAILDYGQFGVVPELEGPLGYVWDFIQPRLDQDRERYEARVQQCAQAAKRRWDQQTNANACAAMPTTTSTPTPTSTSSSTPASTPAEDFNSRRNAALSMLEQYYGAGKVPF